VEKGRLEEDLKSFDFRSPRGSNWGFSFSPILNPRNAPFFGICGIIIIEKGKNYGGKKVF
jgi:hypothetical protein